MPIQDLLRSALLTLVAVAIAGCANDSRMAAPPQAATPKEKVVALIKSLETRDVSAIAVINPSQYIQHNLAVADGLTGFQSLLQALPKESTRARTVRVFQDGDHVFAHTEYELFGPKVGFDIFRFQNGRIVEHWDNLQSKPSTPNPSGRSMTDGSVELSDLASTAANKALVRQFVDEILINGRMDKLAGYFDGDRYLQHNPRIADGLSGLGGAMRAMAQAGVSMRYERIHQVIGEGNFVLVVSEGRMAGKPTSFYDLFRVEAGKLAEHWDTVETIAAPEQRKHQNGKF